MPTTNTTTATPRAMLVTVSQKVLGSCMMRLGGQKL
jgi:hypothetical protein